MASKSLNVHRAVTLYLSMVVGTLLLACASDVEKSGEEPGEAVTGPSPRLSAQHSPGQSDRPQERPLRELADRVDGFAGLYRDAAGTVVVLVANDGDALEAEIAVEQVLERRLRRIRRTHPDLSVTSRRASYTFLQLTDWRDRLFDLLRDFPGVTLLDLDEAGNKVLVGVASLNVVSRLRAVVKEHRVPVAAVKFELRAPYRPDGSFTGGGAVSDSTLSSTFDSVPAGVRTKLTTHTCTQGFSARRVSVGDTIFLISSHCTDSWATTDSTEAFQGNKVAGDKVGEEIVDVEQSCGSSCRWSDAAVFKWTDTARRTFGLIARTEHSNGSRVIDHTNPRWNVGEEETWLAYGDTIHKQGQLGGWEKGTIINTCSDIFNWPSTTEGYTLKCQMIATYDREETDSGGPIFTWQGGEFGAAGMHNGRNGDGDKVFSPIENLENDYGSLVIIGGFSQQ